MTVNPGFGGQKFIDAMIKKISSVSEIISSRDIFLEVDGGINQANAKDVIKAGANVLVAGSSVFKVNKNTSYKINIDALRR